MSAVVRVVLRSPFLLGGAFRAKGHQATPRRKENQDESWKCFEGCVGSVSCGRRSVQCSLVNLAANELIIFQLGRSGLSLRA